MVIAIICAAVANVVVYTGTLIMWHKDCKTIGKEKQAVSLRDRMFAVFMSFTLPCVLGLLLRKE